MTWIKICEMNHIILNYADKRYESEHDIRSRLNNLSGWKIIIINVELVLLSWFKTL